MYGVRLFVKNALVHSAVPLPEPVWAESDRFITHLIGIPLSLFFVSTIAPQWKKAIWWFIGAGLMNGLIGIGSLVLHKGTAIATKVNNIAVLLTVPLLLLMLFVPRRRADQDLWVVRGGFALLAGFVVYSNLISLKVVNGNADLEFAGFIVFLGCLGQVAAGRLIRNEEQLLSVQKELEIARRIQSALLPSHDVAVPGLAIASQYVPATTVAGDFYDFLTPGDGRFGVLIADVSGHGIPAALSASMVKVAIRAQGGHADRPAEVLSGLNSILCGNLQGQFVTAGYVFFDPARRRIAYAGAGHPPMLVWRAREKAVQMIEENGLFLGAFPGCAYTAREFSFDPGDRCVLYTDGVLEAPNPAGEEFGSERLQQFAAANSAMPLAQFCDALVGHLTRWCERARSAEQHDDITLIAVDFAVQ